MEKCKDWVGHWVADYIQNGGWIDPSRLDLLFIPLQKCLLHVHIPSFPIKDSLVWVSSSSGGFSIPKAFSLLSRSFDLAPFQSCLQKKLLIPKVNILFQFFIQIKVLSIDNLCRRGMSFPNQCFHCKESTEDVEHLLLHCSFVQEIWALLLSFGCQLVFPLQFV